MRVHTYLITCVFLTFICWDAAAGGLFKCGAAFQDKPCDSDLQKKFSPVTGTFSNEQVNANADLSCAEIGTRAVPIIQARANNESAESLNSKIDLRPLERREKTREKELVASVFSKKGNSTEVRGAIETECMEAKKVAKRFPPNYTPTETYSSQSAASRRVEAASTRAAAAARAAVTTQRDR